jgi:hypothetical protein
VLQQDYPNIEYIIMDGGSTDGTAAVVEGYTGRLAWYSEKDRGQAHAINKGFQRARGEIVAWLNSDDVLLPGAVGRAVAAFARTPRAGAVYGEGYLLERDGHVTRRFPDTEPFNLWKLVHESDYILQPSTFLRRDAVEQVGWLEEGLCYTMDWDLLIRLGKKFGLQHVPEYLGALREYPEAKSFAGGRRRLAEIRRVLQRHTGMKWPPGYWIYALHSYQWFWRTRLCSSAPRWLRTPAAMLSCLIDVITATGLSLIPHRQGHSPDGWASDRLQWMLPEGTGQIVIRGTVPEDSRLKDQRLSITAESRALGVWQAGPGNFEIRLPLSSGSPHLELRASRYILRKSPRGPGFQRAAFQLRSIDWD